MVLVVLAWTSASLVINITSYHYASAPKISFAQLTFHMAAIFALLITNLMKATSGNLLNSSECPLPTHDHHDCFYSKCMR